MFQCDMCGSTFSEPKIESMSAEQYYGVGGSFNHHNMIQIEVCPFCGHDSFTDVSEEYEEWIEGDVDD